MNNVLELDYVFLLWIWVLISVWFCLLSLVVVYYVEFLQLSAILYCILPRFRISVSWEIVIRNMFGWLIIMWKDFIYVMKSIIVLIANHRAEQWKLMWIDKACCLILLSLFCQKFFHVNINMCMVKYQWHVEIVFYCWSAYISYTMTRKVRSLILASTMFTNT